MLRLLKRIALAAAAVLVLLTGALVVIANVYEEEVKAALVEELNAHLKAPLHQSGIELTLLARFPQASIRLRDVLMHEVRTDGLPADTLVSAGDLYLEFGLLSLLSGDYTIREVHGRDVRVNVGLDTQGAGNWNVWNSDSTASGGTELAVERVTFNGLGLRYHDHRSSLDIRGHSRRMAMRARFREEGSTLTADGDLHLARWSDARELLLADRDADVRLQMAFGSGDGAFRITKGEVLLGNSPVDLTLAVTQGRIGNELDLRANGFGLSLGDVIALLPERMHRPLRHYGVQGRADLAVKYQGPVSGPVLTVAMGLKEGRFTESSTGARFTDVRGGFSAELTPSGGLRKAVVEGLYAKAASGSVNADIELSGTAPAKVNGNLRTDIALADLLRFIRVDTLEQVSGRLKADARVKGSLRDTRDIRPADLRRLALSGTASLHDASLKMKGLKHRIEGLNAELALNGNDAQVNGLRCMLQGNELELTGTLRNLVPYLLLPGERLAIAARGRSPRIDLATLLEDPGTSRSTAYAFTLPAKIDLDLRTDVGVLVMEDFTAEDIKGTLKLNGQLFTAVPLSFRTAGGQVLGSLRLDGRTPGAYPLSIDAEVKGIDVADLFKGFRDFGQAFLTHKHLAGTGDARLTLTAALRPDFTLDQDLLHCVADVSVVNGELNGHGPLLEVADHLQRSKVTSPFVDTKVLRKELQRVRFARLENRIEIKDRQVHLPLMAVSCNVMDLEVSGTHGFDGTVDDHLNFRLGDLFRTGDSGHDEFGPIIDDGTGLRIFLHMYGTTSDLQFGHDGAMAAAKRKEKMKQETAELKGILKGIWTGEGRNTPPPAPQGRVSVDWTAPGTEGGNTATAAEPAPRKTGLGRLFEKERTEEEKVIIEVE